MKLAKIVGRVFCAVQEPSVDGQRLLLIQPLDWETEKPDGDPIVAMDAVGSGSSEKVYFVASREAAVAIPGLPPTDAAVVGIVEGYQVKDFRNKN